MTLYLWDTNTLSDYYRDPSMFQSRMQGLPEQAIAVSTPTVEEVLRGRMAQIATARDEQQRVFALQLLRIEVVELSQLYILDYTERAAAMFQVLRQQHRRISSQDLRIAAIALTTNRVVVTRNTRDFTPLSGLVCENWT